MAKGGGSWKVAYADFVTAMMAFFLVMWIGAQDVKVRQSVANYFIDPAGVSKKPANEGAVLDAPVSGPVPESAKVEGGRGVRPPTGGTPSPTTSAVINWCKRDERFARWKAEAQQCRLEAAQQQAANQSKPPEQVASDLLAARLSVELGGGIPDKTPDVYKDLLFTSLGEVNWKQVADHLLAE